MANVVFEKLKGFLNCQPPLLVNDKSYYPYTSNSSYPSTSNVHFDQVYINILDDMYIVVAYLINHFLQQRFHHNNSIQLSQSSSGPYNNLVFIRNFFFFLKKF